MGKVAKLSKQIISAVFGLPLLIIGIILIPLPGPGLLVSFLALLILSWGFEGAKVHVEKSKQIFKKLYLDAKARADRIEKR
jgi:ABC-type dipeptide/oligopeptide/nickel transport system permease subunit